VIDLLKIPASDAERIAYAEGFTMAAELFARIAELEAERDVLLETLDQCKTDLFIAQREHAYGENK
jgi:hypothetical protein